MRKPTSKAAPARLRVTPAAGMSTAIPRGYHTIALVLQGGGALGAYQGGVYEALVEAGCHPNWIAGISIGALNAAIIAGNPPERRVERLREFWQTICQSPLLPGFAAAALPLAADLTGALRGAVSGWSVWRTLSEGQAGFFAPRLPPAYWLPPTGPDRASYYDTAPLRATLERLVDFDRINAPRQMRVSVGAVNVRTGNFVYFDNTEQTLRPEHFMASGALPPGFPAVQIDGEYYWDGGMVSNTPLYQVLSDEGHRNALVFQVDLWSAAGPLPVDLPQVAERSKDIQYSSRTRLVTEFMRRKQEQQRLLHDLMALVPAAKHADPAFRQAQAHASRARVNVVHLIYRDKPYEGHYKDYEFSDASRRMHWSSGMEDMRHTLSHGHWLDLPDGEEPFVVHDVHRG